MSAVAAAMFVLGCSEPSPDEESACDALHAKTRAALEGEFQTISPAFPGAVLGISTRKCNGWATGTGFVELDPDLPMTPDRVATISSITKTFTSTVVLQLAEEGDISLSAPVANWWPSIPSADSMTVGHLLHMTSGLKDHWASSCTGATPEDLVTCVGAQGLLFAPGTSYRYSNTGYVLLGLIVEAVTGRTLHEEIRERIYEPVGMTDSGFVGDTVDPAKVMHTFDEANADVTGQEDPIATFGCADAIADADDLLAFFRVLFEGTLLSPASLDEMRAFVPTNGFPPGEYGAGLLGATTEGGHHYMLWGNGGRGDVMSEAYYAPELQAVGVLIVNRRYTTQNITLPTAMLRRIIGELGPTILE